MVHIKNIFLKKELWMFIYCYKNILITRPHVSYGLILTYLYIYTYILTFTSCTETHSHYICMTLYTRNVKNSESVCDREMRGKKSKIKDRKSLIDRTEYSI